MGGGMHHRPAHGRGGAMLAAPASTVAANVVAHTLQAWPRSGGAEGWLPPALHVPHSVCVVGRPGCGKTAMLHALRAALSPTIPVIIVPCLPGTAPPSEAGIAASSTGWPCVHLCPDHLPWLSSMTRALDTHAPLAAAHRDIVARRAERGLMASECSGSGTVASGMVLAVDDVDVASTRSPPAGDALSFCAALTMCIRVWSCCHCRWARDGVDLPGGAAYVVPPFLLLTCTTTDLVPPAIALPRGRHAALIPAIAHPAPEVGPGDGGSLGAPGGSHWWASLPSWLHPPSLWQHAWYRVATSVDDGGAPSITVGQVWMGGAARGTMDAAFTPLPIHGVLSWPSPGIAAPWGTPHGPHAAPTPLKLGVGARPTLSDWEGVVGYTTIKHQLASRVIQPFLHGVAVAAAARVVPSTGSPSGCGGGAASPFSPTTLPPSPLHQAMARMQVSPPTGVVLHGPSGCGKTTIASRLPALAPDVSLLHVQCSRMMGKYVGDSERAIRTAFAVARACAPCMLILDNVEVIGGARAGVTAWAGGDGMGSSTTPPRAAGPPASGTTVQDRMLSTLLNELDGVGSRVTHASGVEVHPPLLVVATTTHLSALDAALLRSGRLEVHIHVPLPTAHDRTAAWQAAIMAHAPGIHPPDDASHLAAFLAATDGLPMANVMTAAAAAAGPGTSVCG